MFVAWCVCARACETVTVYVLRRKGAGLLLVIYSSRRSSIEGCVVSDWFP